MSWGAICTYCGVGCKLTMHVDEKKNKIRYIEGGDSPVNEGMLCVKGDLFSTLLAAMRV